MQLPYDTPLEDVMGGAIKDYNWGPPKITPPSGLAATKTVEESVFLEMKAKLEQEMKEKMEEYRLQALTARQAHEKLSQKHIVLTKNLRTQEKLAENATTAKEVLMVVDTNATRTQDARKKVCVSSWAAIICETLIPHNSLFCLC